MDNSWRRFLSWAILVCTVSGLMLWAIAGIVGDLADRNNPVVTVDTTTVFTDGTLVVPKEEYDLYLAFKGVRPFLNDLITCYNEYCADTLYLIEELVKDGNHNKEIENNITGRINRSK